ncbi:hypothetical protein NLI96_g711 [Meripilus lineatus]|uniref:Uncharacterized protein n=1 Tax=Meripilus lineatus TaxID=2056292 RepID=A0AAD5VBU3_9APHY|nr:hypothetical protein NLI96_g711 [Physisporinus lineatus]
MAELVLDPTVLAAIPPEVLAYFEQERRKAITIATATRLAEEMSPIRGSHKRSSINRPSDSELLSDSESSDSEDEADRRQTPPPPGATSPLSSVTSPPPLVTPTSPPILESSATSTLHSPVRSPSVSPHSLHRPFSSSGTSKRKRKSKSSTEEENPWGPTGRTLGRLALDPWTKMHEVVEAGIRVELARNSGEQPQVVDWTDPNSYTRGYFSEDHAGTWELCCSLVPDFRQTIMGLSLDRRTRRRICKLIDKGRRNARGEDTNNLKYGLLPYLNHDYSPVTPTISPDEKSKSYRGWSHDVTAMIITPPDLPANRETYAQVTSGKLLIDHEKWFRGLYPHDHIYDPNNESKGLFRGHVPLRASKIVLTGATSVTRAPCVPSNNCIAMLLGTPRITPRLMGYLMVQTRFALNDSPSWQRFDRAFDARQFYWNVVQFFEDGYGQDVLEYYNLHIFGSKQGRVTTPRVSSGPAVDSAIARLRRQRGLQIVEIP